MNKVVGVTSVEDRVVVVMEDGTVFTGSGSSTWVERLPIPTTQRHRERDPDGWKSMTNERQKERAAATDPVTVI